MSLRPIRAVALAMAIGLSGVASATLPVIDIASLQQLAQQLNAWQQQLRAMQSQLVQLQQTRTALTGTRGMDQLLRQSIQQRNYLPPDWAAVQATISGQSPGYAQLSADIRQQLLSRSGLGAADLSRLPSTAQTMLVADRQAVAASQALSREAYARSSDRFAPLGSLIDRIATTQDVKAIAELQGRIAAEQAMLANETVKLQAYGYSVAAERAAAEVARREAIVHGHGNFSTRFQPTPPAP